MKAHNNWKEFLMPELDKSYYKNLKETLREESKKYVIFPKSEDWFNSLSVDPKEIKVVILGQDPYYSSNQANGYSFSVSKNILPPPSLLNIYKEIENEYKIKMPTDNGNLYPWVEQGVLLLNCILTVRKNEALSHANIGWEEFTNQIIRSVSDNFSPKVFLLWGKYAKEKKYLIDDKKNLVLMSSHPSPRSAQYGFLGNNHFIMANNFLKEHNIDTINWQL